MRCKQLPRHRDDVLGGVMNYTPSMSGDSVTSRRISKARMVNLRAAERSALMIGDYRKREVRHLQVDRLDCRPAKTASEIGSNSRCRAEWETSNIRAVSGQPRHHRMCDCICQACLSFKMPT